MRYKDFCRELQVEKDRSRGKTLRTIISKIKLKRLQLKAKHSCFISMIVYAPESGSVWNYKKQLESPI